MSFFCILTEWVFLPSDPRSRLSQVAKMGNHCSEMRHSAVTRRGMFIVDRVSYAFTDPSITALCFLLSITALRGVHL